MTAAFPTRPPQPHPAQPHPAQPRPARPRPGRARRGTGLGASRPDPLRTLSRLTARDRRLLELLGEHRVLATEHAAAWLFPGLEPAQRRLLVLHRIGVLDRFRTPQLDGAITSWRYTLGTLGAAVLFAMRGTQAPQPAVMRRRTLRLAAHPELGHLLGINHLLSQLAGHSRTQAQPHLALCWAERHATDACGALARPDALLVWGPPTGPQIVGCLEYDTGTEALHRLSDKLPGYTDLALAGGPRLPTGAHGQESPAEAIPLPLWVLFVLPGPRREAHLRDRLATHHAAQNPADPVTGVATLRVATTSAEHLHALGGAAAAIWLPPHTGQRVSLTDLAATTPAGRDR